jgi:hypothetical protein
MIVGPHPPLDFDETTRVLEADLADEYVVVMMIEQGRGNPSVTLRGWLHLDVEATGASLTIRSYPKEQLEFARALGNVLWISREEFRAAGEAPEAESPGPLTILLVDRSVIIDGGDRVPGWEQLERR